MRDILLRYYLPRINIYGEIHEFQPDVIILDIFLRGKDGRELCKELKKDIETKYLGILAFSATPKNLIDYKSYYADDFMENHFDIKTLKEKTKSLLFRIPIRKKAFFQPDVFHALLPNK